jgi:coenzyme F420-reducing hydrogenase alpha subunit
MLLDIQEALQNGKAMIAEGKLQLEVVWDGKQITGVSVQSSRPLAACRVLEGKPAEEVMRLVPLLFSVCGRAQGVAAAAACEAARGIAPNDLVVVARERAIAGECLQEYTWRLLIDLPALLGEAARPGELADLRRRIVTARDELRWHDVAGAAEELLERAVYEMSPRVWLGLRPASFEKWVARGEAPMQRMLARLRTLRLGGDFGLLPWLGEADLLALSARLDVEPDFSQRPTWQGEPAETGALARQLGHPVLAREVGQYGATAAARLLARLLELAQLPEQLRQPRAVGIRCTSPRPGSGIAAVETARGTLLHQVTLAGDHVAHYRIVAPTEWNFHPRGAFVRGLLGCPAKSETEARGAAGLLAHALDPCVAYEVSVARA